MSDIPDKLRESRIEGSLTTFDDKEPYAFIVFKNSLSLNSFKEIVKIDLSPDDNDPILRVMVRLQSKEDYVELYLSTVKLIELLPKRVIPENNRSIIAQLAYLALERQKSTFQKLKANRYT